MRPFSQKPAVWQQYCQMDCGVSNSHTKLVQFYWVLILLMKWMCLKWMIGFCELTFSKKMSNFWRPHVSLIYTKNVYFNNFNEKIKQIFYPWVGNFTTRLTLLATNNRWSEEAQKIIFFEKSQPTWTSKFHAKNPHHLIL